MWKKSLFVQVRRKRKVPYFEAVVISARFLLSTTHLEKHSENLLVKAPVLVNLESSKSKSRDLCITNDFQVLSEP